MTTASTAIDKAVEKGLLDPYALNPSDVLEPPTTLGNILRKIGPGIVLSASIVGSSITGLLWLGATVITAFVLVSEFRRWFI